MDTVTQMLFGATVAQAGFRRKLGRGALPAGALIALVPDLDVAVGWFGGPFLGWEHHRGITHSVFFGPVIGPLFGWAAWRLQRRLAGDRAGVSERDALRSWIYLAIAALVTHPLIDLFTSYGTQLLSPFSTYRFAINAMPIIDPIYSLALVVALCIGIFAASRPRLAQDAASVALAFVAAYTLYGWSLNGRVEEVARAHLGGAVQITAYPTLFQPFYRRIVAESDEAVRIGFYSVLSPAAIEWRTFPLSGDPRIRMVAELPEARLFRWFSMDRLYWSVLDGEDGTAAVVAFDLRYGLPGSSELGFWGIRALLDGAGGLASPVEYMRVSRDASPQALQRFWIAIIGARD